MNNACNTNCTSTTNKNLDFYISFFNISQKQFRNIFVNKKYCRKLAKILGSLDCVEFFKEIYFFCTAKSGGILLDGQRYIYNSFKAWQDQLDDIRCDRTLQNYAKKLVETGLVTIKRLRKHEFNHTNYYTVNFEKLFELIDFQPKEKGKKKKDKKSSNNNSQNAAETCTTDIDGEIIARSNVEALNLNTLVLDNESVAQPITKSLHDDPYTIDNSNTRDHLLEGDRKKNPKPVKEMKIENKSSNIGRLGSNQVFEPALNELETGVNHNELENLNESGLLAETGNFEAITETTTEMPVKDKSCGAVSTNELTNNNNSQNDSQSTDVPNNKKIVNEATLDLGIKFMFPQQKAPKPVTQEQLKKQKYLNEWNKPIMQGFLRRMDRLKMKIDAETIKFMLNHDYSQVEIALTDLERNSAVIRNFNAVFRTAVINAKPEFLGARNIYDEEQRERDRKFEESVMQPNVIAERGMTLQDCKKIAERNKGIHFKKVHKNHPLAHAYEEVELMQNDALTESEAYAEAMRLRQVDRD